jgi:hypothetical protein
VGELLDYADAVFAWRRGRNGIAVARAGDPVVARPELGAGQVVLSSK